MFKVEKNGVGDAPLGSLLTPSFLFKKNKGRGNAFPEVPLPYKNFLIAHWLKLAHMAISSFNELRHIIIWQREIGLV